MIALLATLARLAFEVVRWRASASGRPVSIRRARRRARMLARDFEGAVPDGAERREAIVAALVADGVPEPIARVVTEAAAARYSLKGKVER